MTPLCKWPIAEQGNLRFCAKCLCWLHTMIIANNLGFVNQLETRAYNTKDITPNKKLNDSGQEALRFVTYI